MNIKKLSLNLSFSLMAFSMASSAFAQNNGQLKKDFAAALQVSEADVDPILTKQASGSGDFDSAAQLWLTLGNVI